MIGLLDAAQGRPSPPEAMMHFPPCFRIFRFPLFSTNFTIFRKNFRFSSAKISDDLHRPQISNSPYFPCFNTFPPVSRKLLFPPYFQKFPPCFQKIICFLHTLRV